jgi:hypothetical protein
MNPKAALSRPTSGRANLAGKKRTRRPQDEWHRHHPTIRLMGTKLLNHDSVKLLKIKEFRALIRQYQRIYMRRQKGLSAKIRASI